MANINFKVGDVIFYQNHMSGVVDKAIILSIEQNQNGQSYYRIIDLDIGGECGCLVGEAYSTKEDCLAAVRGKEQKEIEEYKSQIKTVEDLIRFLFEHPMTGEDTDYEAKAAAIEMAEKLCGVRIEE